MTKQLKQAEPQNLLAGKTLSNFRQANRRNFLKAGATVGASFLAAPAFSASNETAFTPNASAQSKLTQHRTLGSGKYSLKVSGLGLVWAVWG